MRRRTLEVDRPGQRVAAFLAASLAIPEEEAAVLVRNGAAYVDGRRCTDPALALREGAVVSAILEEAGRSTLEQSARPPDLEILYEDADLLAVNKPAGLNAQPSAGRRGESLLDAVAARMTVDPGLVHRLDRETSGVTVFGKTRDATSRLAEQFRRARAKKRYLAICGPGLPERGSIDLPISPDPSRPGRYRATREANGVSAQTEFVRLHSAPDHCVVALYPRTGRTHQLRAHLTALHAPIAGDRRYGGATSVLGREVSRCLLHAQALSLPHPRTGAPLLIEAPVPEDMLDLLRADGISPPSGPW